MSLARLIRGVWRRYRHDILITETAHVGEKRGAWLGEVARQSEALLREGVPLRGVCLYPILGMPEWHEPEVWTAMGLWDPVSQHDPAGPRLACRPMMEALHGARNVGREVARPRASGVAAPARQPVAD